MALVSYKFDAIERTVLICQSRHTHAGSHACIAPGSTTGLIHRMHQKYLLVLTLLILQEQIHSPLTILFKLLCAEVLLVLWCFDWSRVAMCFYKALFHCFHSRHSTHLGRRSGSTPTTAILTHIDSFQSTNWVQDRSQRPTQNPRNPEGMHSCIEGGIRSRLHLINPLIIMQKSLSSGPLQLQNDTLPSSATDRTCSHFDVSRRLRSLRMNAEPSGQNGSSSSCGSTFIRAHLQRLAPYTPIEPFEILSKR